VVKSSLNPDSPAFVPNLGQATQVDAGVSDDDSQTNFEAVVELYDNSPSESSQEDCYIDDNFTDADPDCNDSGNSSMAALNVYLTSLEPEDVLILPVTLCGVPLKAMIDTGANTNLIKEDIVQALNLPVDSSQTAKIKGLGDSEMVTKGTVQIGLTVLNKQLNTACCNVMTCHDRKYDIILGEQYLYDNKFILNIKRRRISFKNADGSRSDYYVSKSGDAVTAVHERVPVVAAEHLSLGKEARPLRVNFCIAQHQVEKPRRLFYFDGRMKDKGVTGYEGFLEEEQKEKYVVVANKHKGNPKQKVNIKPGDIVGYVSTVIETEHEDVEPISWSLEELRSKVEVGSHITDLQKESVFNMLAEVQEVFGKTDNDVGRANVPPHSIELTDHTPIWQRPRRFPDPVTEDIEQQCKELLALDIISFSNSPWSSPIVPVRKKDGQLRLCIDYRKLNSVTKPDRFPMPNLSDSVYAAHNMKYFTTIDVVKGYYQVELDEESKPYTAFSTPHEHYQFNRVSFGLKNSGIAFQKGMQQLLSGFNYRNVIVYIDDILVMTESFEEHIKLLQKLLYTLARNGVKVKTAKCKFFMEEVAFLGHVIGVEGMRKAPEYMEKIRNYPKPATVTELRQFLGLVNFQCKFIENCSSIAKPLSVLTGGPKRKRIEWTEDMELAFDTLRSKLLQDVTLSFPDYSKDAAMMELFVDASGVGAGGCLVQKQNGVYRTIAYASITFSSAQVRYSTIERELAAIRWGVKSFRPFIFGVPFILYTDHKPLVYLHRMACDNSRLMRTVNELADYDFVIKYRPGAENAAADSMSRVVNVPSDREYECLLSGNKLPKGLEVLLKVEGGGDSLFESVFTCLKYDDDENDVEIPSQLEMRQRAVELVLSKPQWFGIKLDKGKRKSLMVMRQAGCVPSDEIVLALAEVLQIEIWIHHGMNYPVIFSCKRQGHISLFPQLPVVHLQCKSGIHFNPVVLRKGCPDLAALVKSKNVNRVHSESNDTAVVMKEVESEEEEQFNLVYVHRARQNCNHPPFSGLSGVAHMGYTTFCTMIDTGAEVSLIDIDTVNRLMRESTEVKVKDSEGRTIKGIDRSLTVVLGVTSLRLSILGVEMQKPTTFAVVNKEAIPCCCLLGADFLRDNDITIDFMDGFVYGLSDGQLRYPLQLPDRNVTEVNTPSAVNFVFTAGSLDDTEDDSEVDTGTVDAVQFALTADNLLALQESDFAVRLLKRKLLAQIPPKLWQNRCLHRFKRHSSKLKVVNDLLVNDSFDVPVVSFRLLIDIVYKVHSQLGHVGRGKVIEIIARNFWHPSLDMVARDVCSTCEHCQLFKISAQAISPPTIKIKAAHPFDLVAMDTCSFQRTARGYVAVLVVIDHFSKFLMAVPLRDKRAETITNIVEHLVLPKLVRLPNRILTDNGPEFIATQFGTLLDIFNIEHIRSTHHRPQGNGAVERSNRSLIELLKGFEGNCDWDLDLPRAVTVYNATLHREIGACPSDFLLQRAHSFSARLPIHTDVISNWKKGHPSFAPFRVNQKVVHKINRIGRQLRDKLAQKYDGPYFVVKVQSNDVSYEIRLCDEPNGRIHKVHHKQLKAWNEPPLYLRKYTASVLCGEQEVERVVEEIESDSSGLVFGGMLGFVSSSEESDPSAVFSVIDSVESDDSLTPRMSLRTEFSSSESDFVSHSECRVSKSLPLLQRSSLLPLEKLACSAPVHFWTVQEVKDDAVVLSVPGGNLSSTDASGFLTSRNCRKSTPVKDSVVQPIFEISNFDFSGFEPKRHTINSSENYLEENSGDSNVVTDRSTSDVIQMVSQALEYQEELVESLQLALVSDGEDKPIYNEVCLKILQNEETFEGFGESEAAPSSAKLEILKMMRKHIQHTNKCIKQYSTNDDGRKGWKKRYDNSHSRIPESDLSGEVSDTLAELPVLDFSRSGVITRQRTARLEKWCGLCNN